MKLILVPVLAAAFASCEKQADEPEGMSDCARACLRMSELNCPEAEPDEEGTTCVEICEETQAAGLIDLEPEKIAESDSCP